MRSKFKKAKLKNFQKIFFQSNQKSRIQRKALKDWQQWLINKQPNTFVNWHLSNNENSTKIKCVRNRFWQSKAAMKVQNIKRQVSRKMVTNKFLEKKEQMVTKNDSVKQTQMSRKQDGHKDWKQSFHSAETEQSRFLDRNLVCQKSMTLAINEQQD